MNHKLIAVLMIVTLVIAGCTSSSEDAKRQICQETKNTCQDICNTQPENEKEPCKARCDNDYYICKG